MKTALVLGAGGFIGSHLVKRLKLEEYFVIGIDLKYPDFSVDVTAPFLYSSVTKDFSPDVRTAVVCMAVPVDLTVPLCTAVPDGLTVLHYSSVADGSSARLHKLVGGYSLPVFHLYR